MVRIGNCFRLLSHILGDTINQTQLRRIPDMLDHLVSIHMVSQEPESWAEVGCQKKLQLQLYVSIIFPIPKKPSKITIFPYNPIISPLLLPRNPEKIGPARPQAVCAPEVAAHCCQVHSRGAPGFRRPGDRKSPRSVLRKIGRKSGSHGMFSNKMMM